MEMMKSFSTLVEDFQARKTVEQTLPIRRVFPVQLILTCFR